MLSHPLYLRGPFRCQESENETLGWGCGASSAWQTPAFQPPTTRSFSHSLWLQKGCTCLGPLGCRWVRRAHLPTKMGNRKHIKEDEVKEREPGLPKTSPLRLDLQEASGCTSSFSLTHQALVQSIRICSKGGSVTTKAPLPPYLLHSQRSKCLRCASCQRPSLLEENVSKSHVNKDTYLLHTTST